jgi:hypothetical protein
VRLTPQVHDPGQGRPSPPSASERRPRDAPLPDVHG